MTPDPTYRSPTAFRQALTYRLKQEAREGRWTLHQLQRHVAYDALLQRLYQDDRGWVLKGAVALIARDISGRGSIDIDLHRAAAPDELEATLRQAAVKDLGD